LTEAITNTPAKFDPAKLSGAILKLAQSVNNPDALLEIFSLDDDAPQDITRAQARELIAYAHQELELDKTAATPTSVDPLSRKIDYNLNKQIDAITQENELLHRISRQDPDKVYRVEATGEVLTPMEARRKIRANLDDLMDIKKHLTDQKKAEQGPGNPNTSLSLNVDLGSVITKTLGNIESAKEAKIIDV